MVKATDDSAAAESIEAWFFQTTIKTDGCSLEPAPDKELCPGYYKVLAAAADWHAVTAVFAVILVCLFVGMAVGKKE